MSLHIDRLTGSIDHGKTISRALQFSVVLLEVWHATKCLPQSDLPLHDASVLLPQTKLDINMRI